MARIWDYQGIEHETVIQANLCSLFFPKLTKYWRGRGMFLSMVFFEVNQPQFRQIFLELFTTRFLIIIYILHYHFLKLRSRSNTNSWLNKEYSKLFFCSSLWTTRFKMLKSTRNHRFCSFCPPARAYQENASTRVKKKPIEHEFAYKLALMRRGLVALGIVKSVHPHLATSTPAHSTLLNHNLSISLCVRTRRENRESCRWMQESF